MSKPLQQITDTIKAYRALSYKRDPKTIVFGAWYGERFADNPKYLYLEAQKHKNLNAIWITRNFDVYTEMTQLELPVAMVDSTEGKQAMKMAKYFVVNIGKNDLDPVYMGGAVIINLWHGVTFKKVNLADTYHATHQFFYLIRDIVGYIPFRKEYVIATSEMMQKIYESSFRKNKKHVPIYGQPRNDLFFLDSFPESDDTKIYKNKKIISYMPTYRSERKFPMDLEEIINLNQLDSICEKYNYLFFIKRHFHDRDKNLNSEKYANIIEITDERVDTQELLKYTDILITDYSSCYLDYLLLERPIIFFAYDYEDYFANEREFLCDYELITVGPIAKTGDELLTVLEKTIINPDMQYDKRQEVKHMSYSKESSEPCGEKILQFMKTL